MTARRVLMAAISLYESRGGTHTTGALARDMSGNPVAASSPYATCWCTNGVLLKVGATSSLDTPGVFEASQALTAEAQAMGFTCTTKCNDALGRDGAIQMLRRALAGLPTLELVGGAG